MTAIRVSSMFWAAFTATILAGCGEPIATLLPETGKLPTASTGCLGQKLESCVDSVRRFIPVNAPSNGPNFSPDIQGKIPTSARTNFDSANIYDQTAIGQPTYAFFAEFGANQRIKSMSIMLDNIRTITARTEEDYEKTGIYEAVEAVAQGDCATSKADFYKLFDAATRGKMNYHKEVETTHYIMEDHIGAAKPLYVCGLHIKYSTHAMEGADLVSSSNLSGTSVASWLEIN